MEVLRKLVEKFASEYTLVALVIVYGAIRLTLAPTTAEWLTTDIVLLMAALAAMLNGLLGE